MKAIVRHASTWTTKREGTEVLGAHASIRVSPLTDSTDPSAEELTEQVPEMVDEMEVEEYADVETIAGFSPDREPILIHQPVKRTRATDRTTGRKIHRPHPEVPGALSYVPRGIGVFVKKGMDITYEKSIAMNVDTYVGALQGEELAKKLDAIRTNIAAQRHAFDARLRALAAIQVGDEVDTDDLEKI